MMAKYDDPDPEVDELDEDDGQVTFEDDAPEAAPVDELEDDLEDELDDDQDGTDLEIGDRTPPDSDSEPGPADADAANKGPGERAQARAIARRPIIEGPDDGDAEGGGETVVDADANEAPTEVPSNVRMVELGSLVLEYKFWKNPRRHLGLDDTSIGDLAQSIRQRTVSGESGSPVYAGIKDPLEVVRIAGANGVVVELVIDGQRRHMAAHVAGLQTDALIPVIDLEPEPVEWTEATARMYLVSALETVRTRQGLGSFDLSENAAELKDTRDPDTGKMYTLDKIGQIIGRSASWVSKILTAREHATPKLIQQWRKGEVTDEQFKDLASQRDHELQSKAAGEAVEARKKGDAGAARALAKETKEKERQAAKPAPKAGNLAKASSSVGSTAPEVPGGAAQETKAAKGDQVEMPASKPMRPPPFAVVEDMLATAVKHPATHDYVKGLLDGVRWDRGLLDASKFASAWQVYMHRVQSSYGRDKPADKGGKPDAKAKSRKSKKRK
ncbi:MAG: hypothetical protein WA418_24540 [Bradyrhizobium sp.]